jgi:hypothetical protein
MADISRTLKVAVKVGGEQPAAVVPVVADVAPYVPPYVPPILMGLNVIGSNYYTSSCAFINYIHGSSYPWTDSGNGGLSSIDPATDWPINLPPGKTVSRAIFANITFPYGYIKPGHYIMTWSGPATVTINGLATNIVNTANRVTFDLLDAGLGCGALDATSGGNTYFIIRNANAPGGANISCTDLAMYHADDESDFLAGEIFQREFIARLTGASLLRHLGLMSTSGPSVVENFADLPTEASGSWVQNGIGVPPSVIAKLAVKTGTDLHLTMYPKATQSCMNSVMQAIWNTPGVSTANFKIYCEFSNENWNNDFHYPSVYMANTKAPSLPNYNSTPTCIVNSAGNPDVTKAYNNRIACAAAHGAMQCWTAAETYFPRSRIKRVYCGQGGYFAYLAAGFEYADLSGTLFGGAKLKTLVDAYGIAPYFQPDIGGLYGIPADMSKKAQVTRQDYLQPDDWWTNAVQNSLDQEVSPMITSSTSGAQAYRSDIEIISYELGHQFQLALDYTQNWSATVIDNELDFGSVDISAIFDDHDQMAVSYQLDNGQFGGALFLNASPWRGILVRIGSTNHRLKVFATQTDYDSNTPATLNTVASVGGLGDGKWRIDNLTRVQALGARYAALLDSAVGVSWYQKHFDLCKSLGLKTYTHLVDVAGFSSTGGGSQYWFHWGLKRSQWEPDLPLYPRADWFRKLSS